MLTRIQTQKMLLESQGQTFEASLMSVLGTDSG